MIRSRKCSLCSHRIEANGFSQFSEKARVHWSLAHKTELGELQKHNDGINQQIRKLEKQIQRLFLLD